MKFLHIIFLGLALTAVGTVDTQASWRKNFTKLVKQKVASGQLSTESALNKLKTINPKELESKEIVEAVKKDISDPKKKLTQKQVLTMAPVLATHLIPEYIIKAVETLGSKKYDDMQKTLKDFADQKVINENFTKFSSELKLTQKAANQKLSDWLKDTMDKMFGAQGKYKGATTQKNQLQAMHTMVRLLEADLRHVTDAGLLTNVYKVAKEQGANFNLLKALRVAVGNLKYNGEDINDDVAKLIQNRRVRTINAGVHQVKISKLTGHYQNTFGLDRPTSVNVAKAFLRTNSFERALRGHLTVPRVDGNDIKEAVVQAIARDGKKLQDAVNTESINVRKLKFQSYGFMPKDAYSYAEYMTQHKTTHRVALEKNFHYATRYGNEDISDRVIDHIFQRGMLVSAAKKKASRDSYEMVFKRFKLPPRKAKAAAQYLSNRINPMPEKRALKTTLNAVLNAIPFEAGDIKQAVADKIVDDGVEYKEAVKGVKINKLTDKFVGVGISKIQAAKVAKAIIRGARSQKQALSDYLKAVNLKNPRYQVASDEVADALLRGAKLNFAVKKAKLKVEKDWFTTKKVGLGLSASDVLKAAKATVADKSNSRLVGLVKVLKSVNRNGRDLTRNVALEMIRGVPSKFNVALKVVLKAFWGQAFKHRIKLDKELDYKNLANAYVDDSESNLETHLATVLGSIKRPGKLEELNLQIATLMVLKGHTLKKAKKDVFVKKIKDEIDNSYKNLVKISSNLAETMYEITEKLGNASNLETTLKDFISKDMRFGKKPSTEQADEILKAVLENGKTLDEAFSTVFLGEIGGLVKAKYSGLNAEDVQEIAKRVQKNKAAIDLQEKIKIDSEKYLYTKYKSKLFAKWADHFAAFLDHISKGKKVDAAIKDSALEKVKKMLVKVLDGAQKMRDEEFDNFAENYCNLVDVDFSSKSIEEEFKVYLHKGFGVDQAELDNCYSKIKDGTYFNYRNDGQHNLVDLKSWLEVFVELKRQEAQAKAARVQKRQKDWDDALYSATVAFGSYRLGFYCVNFNKVKGKRDIRDEDGIYWYIHPNAYKSWAVPGQIEMGDKVRFSSRPVIKKRGGDIYDGKIGNPKEEKQYKFPNQAPQKIIEWVKGRYGYRKNPDSSDRRENTGNICIRYKQTRGLIEPVVLRACYRYSAQLYKGSYEEGFIACVRKANNEGISDKNHYLNVLKLQDRNQLSTFIDDCLQVGHARSNFKPKRSNTPEFAEGIFPKDFFANISREELRKSLFETLLSRIVFIAPKKYAGKIKKEDLKIGDIVKFNFSNSVHKRAKTQFKGGDFEDARITDIVDK